MYYMEIDIDSEKLVDFDEYKAHCCDFVQHLSFLFILEASSEFPRFFFLLQSKYSHVSMFFLDRESINECDDECAFPSVFSSIRRSFIFCFEK